MSFADYTPKATILTFGTDFHSGGPVLAGQLLGFFFREAWHAHFGSLHLTEMVVGSHCIS